MATTFIETASRPSARCVLTTALSSLHYTAVVLRQQAYRRRCQLRETARFSAHAVTTALRFLYRIADDALPAISPPRLHVACWGGRLRCHRARGRTVVFRDGPRPEVPPMLRQRHYLSRTFCWMCLSALAVTCALPDDLFAGARGGGIGSGGGTSAASAPGGGTAPRGGGMPRGTGRRSSGGLSTGSSTTTSTTSPLTRLRIARGAMHRNLRGHARRLPAGKRESNGQQADPEGTARTAPGTRP